MAQEMRKNRPHEQGFTLAFTIVLTVVLSMAAVAIMARIFVSTRNAGFTREHQNTMDSAVIALNMAIDEISPGIDRMRNTVWTSGLSSIPAAEEYPTVRTAQTQVKSTGASADIPVRELSLAGNIRNWEAFANWNGATTAAWNKGWVYVASSSAVQYFDAAPGQTGQATVSVGNENLTGAYWYKQLEPKPPTLSDGAPDVPKLPDGTKVWPNTRGGAIYGNEYPYGLFCQPVLRKVYQVRQNPMVRVAVYVRMSLQDYYSPEIIGGQLIYSNRHLDGRTIPTGQAGMDTASPSFNGRNFLDTNAITFSVFAVSEGTPESKGVRIHQALNITLGGAEYISGSSPRISNGSDINSRGLENPQRLYKAVTPPDAYLPPYIQCLSPYFAPALDTPSGNNQLTAYAPITGQVYPASGDLSYKFNALTRPATEQVVFLYEKIKMAGGDNEEVVFLIEQIPPGVAGNATPYWRRRLLYDYPRAYSAYWNDPSGTQSADVPIVFSQASYSIDPWIANNSGFPSMAWWANKKREGRPFLSMEDPDEHFYTSANVTRTDGSRYPSTAFLDPTGTFTIGTRSASDFGIPAGDTRGDVLNWPGNPLVDFRGGRLAASMPWQGPTIPLSQAGASVSYLTTTWPYKAYSSRWLGQGGGIGLSFSAATWSVF